MAINIGALSALGSLLSTDLMVVSRDGTELRKVTLATLFADPTFTGTPSAPTPAKANSSTRLATTAYVKNNLSDYARLDSINQFLTGQIVGDGVAGVSMALAGGAGTSRLLVFASGDPATDPRGFIGTNSDSEAGTDQGSAVIIGTSGDTPSVDVAIKIKRDTAEPVQVLRDLELVSSQLYVDGDRVVRERQTGWAAATGTLSRAAFDGDAATLSDTRQTLAALLTDLRTHGLIGT